MAATATFILIAEDEPAHAEAIRRAFKAAGAEAECQVVGSLREYVQAVAARPPDIALVDVNLPDGRALAVLTAPPEEGLFPVVVMTSYGNERMAVEAMKAGAIDYIPKSAEAFASLPHVVQRNLDQWQLLQEHKRAEETLRESEERFRAIADYTADWENWFGPDGKLLWVNPAVERITGYSVAECHAMPTFPLPLIAEEDLPVASERLQEAVHGTHGNDLEVRFVRKDGTKWWGSVAWQPSLASDGTAMGHRSSIRDISRSKQAEAALGEAARLNQQVIAGAQEGIIVYGPDLRYQVWNPYMEALTGLSAKEVLGKRPLEAFPFLREGGVIERLERALAGESPGPVDFPFHVPLTGRTGWSSDLSAPLRSADGKIIGVIATVRDITERKKTEAALAEETARRRILFEQSPDGIVILDPQTTRFLEFNAAAHRQLGYSREEFARLSLCDVEAMETPDQVKARIAGMLGGGRADFETLHRTRQGALRNVLVTAQIMDVMGRCVYYCVWRDITQRKELELKLLYAQKMEAIGLLAGGVAHDFRNQLTVIKGYGEMLLRRSLVKDEGREKLEQILKAADRSAIISGQLLAFSRQQVLRPEVISLNSVASDIIKSLAQTLGEDIRLSVIPCGDLWNIRVDVGQFQQALLNLVLNARDAMPQGGRLTIQTENALLDESFVRRHVGVAAGRHAVVSVNDTGAGMSPQTLDRLFEPFFTTKPAGEGTGLGLAMVHGFVAQSGGFIEVHSRPGQGTTFRLYFPAVDDVAQAAQRPSPATDLSRGSGTVLVVEDEETIRRILLETLGECGYTILTAGNAREAMALTKSAKQKIDLLISDVVMPGWSGPELAKHFQAARPGVPVLLISGHTGKMLTGHGVVSPDVNLLIKPFSSQTLAQTVGRILGQPKGP